MALVGENGAATFVILDREPLYDQDDIARIACDHAIAPADRNADTSGNCPWLSEPDHDSVFSNDRGDRRWRISRGSGTLRSV